MELFNKLQPSSNSIKNQTSNKSFTNKSNSNNDFDNLISQLNMNNKDDSNKESSDFMSQKSGNIYGGQVTDKGTQIIMPGQDMDKNAFLQILSSQLANQDPTQPQDGTEYVSQFAQFAAMEQMTNLNKTMSGFASQSLIGKGVMLNAHDSSGNAIVGIVKSVAQSGSKNLVAVEYVNDKGELVLGEFQDSDVLGVLDVPDNRLDYMNNNMAMLVGSSMIDKDIEFIVDNEEDTEENEDKVEEDTDTEKPQYETKKGTVQSVIIENFTIKLKVKIDGVDELETVTLDKVTKVNGELYDSLKV